MVLTSLYEGLPNVLLEALTLKKFIIENGKNGFLFKMKDYNQLAKKIFIYSKNKKLYKNKIISGYRSLDRFDFNYNCKKYYNEILKIL